MEISVFRNAKDPVPASKIDIDTFLNAVQHGAYKTEVEQVRSQTRDKASLQCVSMSGTFAHRRASDLLNHSGFICMDLDKLDDVDEVKCQIYSDPYLFAGFESVSGKGLALVFRIKPEKHGEMFDSISDYLYKKYGVISDLSCRDVSRLRFVSFDPLLYQNRKAHLYNIPLKKDPVKNIPRFIHVRNDFEKIISIINERQIDITSDYRNWVRIGFGIADTYGEEGRAYFHDISQVSSKYTYSNCDKQYNNCLKAGGSSKVTLSTFYYLAKEANIPIYSDTTREIASTATMNKKERLTKQQAAQTIIEFGGFDAEEVSNEQITDIVNQIYDNDINFNSDKSPIEQFEDWLTKNYTFRRNDVTRNIECDGIEMTDAQANDIYRKVKKVLPKVTSEMIEKVINSNFIESYNPFYQFYEKYKERNPSGCIDTLFGSIETKTGHDKKCYDFAQYFGKKWLVSVIAASYYKHSPLMLVLADGAQGIGKTEFFRRLMPQELHPYFADSKLDQGKDDDILMTQKLIIFDDEMSGKSKQDIRMLKTKTSVQEFTLREPYGRRSVRLQRLAVLCGSTNESEVINDPTGNRRIIPIGTISINHDKYNSVDKIDLFMEAYHLYKSGFNYQLTRDDVQLLNACTGQFEMISIERESIASNLVPGQRNEYGVMDAAAEFMTATQVLIHLKIATNIQNLNPTRIGQELKSLGFDKVGNYLPDLKKTIRGYWVKKVTSIGFSSESDYETSQVSDNEAQSVTDCPF